MSYTQLRAFRHQPLNSIHNEIRLLRLRPSLDKDAPQDLQPISCDLEHVSLDTRPDYIAVSYVCGDPTTSSFLRVNEQILQITNNLEMALRHLQDILKSSRLWIDAVCISQSDAVEKSAEIRRMFSIYANAKTVVSWLGPAADDSDLAIRSIDKMGCHVLSCGPLQEILAGCHDHKIEQLKRNATIGQGSEVTIPISPLVSLFQREFWRRIWIMQEVTMSKVLIFVCGQSSVAWHPFFSGCWLLQLIKIPIGSRFEVDWSRLKDAYSQVNFFIGGSFLYKFGYNQTGPKESLRTLLEVSRQHTRSSDPRDMVFALVEIASDWKELGMVVDYSKTFQEIFIDVARAYIRLNDLDILFQAPDAAPRSPASLPSWVPDWTSPLSVNPISKGFSDDRPFSASGNSTSNKCPSGDVSQSRVIVLEGIKISKVASTGRVCNIDQQNPSLQELSSWFEELDELSHSEFRGSGLLEEAVWWTPIAFRKPLDAIWRHRSEILRQAYQILRGTIYPLKEAQVVEVWRLQIWEAYIYAMTRTASGRRAFISERGELGLGPSNIQRGDLICIMLGIKVPLIIRRLQAGTHMLIGDAYVYGIMHGEHMDTNPVAETFEIE